jgi:hypothetical protein
MGRRGRAEIEGIEGWLGRFLRIGEFWAGQRRGAHVSTLKIGSRGELFCFGGILGFYAVLRRE